MDTTSSLFLALDLTGVFAFALNGALTASRLVRLDIVGVITLGMFTALGGGMVRDILLGSLPPATFRDWRYLAVAATGSMVAFAFGHVLDRVSTSIVLLDAAGLSLFAVSGALKGMSFDAGVAQATILGAITAVGGGTMRDVLIQEVPAVLSSGLYAIPALIGAVLVAGGSALGTPSLATALVAAATCFAIRMLGVVLGLDAPTPPGTSRGA